MLHLANGTEFSREIPGISISFAFASMRDANAEHPGVTSILYPTQFYYICMCLCARFRETVECTNMYVIVEFVVLYIGAIFRRRHCMCNMLWCCEEAFNTIMPCYDDIIILLVSKVKYEKYILSNEIRMTLKSQKYFF